MFKNLDDLCKALADEPIIEKPSITARCFRLYFRSQKAAEKFGFVGVGCITFAENRLVEFQRRVYGFKHKIGQTVMVHTSRGCYEALITGYGKEQAGDQEHLVYDLVTAAGQSKWAYREQIDG